MIIDGHIHIGSWNYKYYSSLSVDICQLNKLLDRCGIDGAVLVPTDRRENHVLLNEIKRKGNKRYWFFPWINPKEDDWRTFLGTHIKEISGIKVHSSLDHILGGITNKIYMPLLEFAQKEGLLMYVHCGRWQEAASYKFVLQMARKYNKANFIIAHLGGDHEELKIQAPLEVKKSRLKNVFFDISATREFWAIESGLRLLGADRFIFGSDYPVMHPQVALEIINVLDIPMKDKEFILSGNLSRLLNNRKVT